MTGVAYTGLAPTDTGRRLDPTFRLRFVSGHYLSPFGDVRPPGDGAVGSPARAVIGPAGELFGYACVAFCRT